MLTDTPYTCIGFMLTAKTATLKRLAIFGAILAGFLASGHPQNDSGKQQPGSQSGPSPSVPIVESSTPQAKTNSTAQKPPEPHAGIEWSNWALVLVGALGVAAGIFTLKAIEEQGRIANAALIAQFRPKIVVRNMRLDPASWVYYERRADGKWKIELQIMNIGGTLAVVQKVEAFFQEYDKNGSPRKDLAEWKFWTDPISLKPGERRALEIALDGERFKTYMHTLEATAELADRQERWPVCHGTITYTDGNGFNRETGFGRQWDVRAQHFEALGDPNYEYQD
jgi:hypothetical protein